MNIFLSWSGRTSNEVAKVLKTWLPQILTHVDPWLSDEIKVGVNWQEALMDALKEADFGIVCLTNSNIWAPWLSFESGFLVGRFFGQKQGKVVVPFLFEVDTAELKGPLSAYEYATSTRDGVWRLIDSIKKFLGTDVGIDDAVVREKFETCWNHIKGEFDSISSNREERGTGTPYPWLYTFDSLLRDEEEEGIAGIWIVTDHVIKHLTQHGLLPRLTANIAKGIKYRFYFPKYTTLPPALTDLPSFNTSVLDCRVFDKDDFNGQAATDYIVINLKDGSIRAFFRAPVDWPDEFWVKVDQEPATRLRQRFYAFWERGQKLGSSVTA